MNAGTGESVLKLLTIEPIAFVYSPILHTTWRSCQLFF
eukprot:COSAG02_NODE_64548_length_260_cov_0.645963_2_plen_37_part_01